MNTCICCGIMGKNEPGKPTWWHLTLYFGLTGIFCPDCYNKVAHDGFGNPKNPEEYLAVILRLK